mmetsp:Transcript_62870/g.142096  ORF Transcript_62870/g.142096 Transcript_62870/m.142096 type:complete len:217 (-) Transcript_62870:698-1348(-)
MPISRRTTRDIVCSDDCQGRAHIARAGGITKPARHCTPPPVMLAICTASPSCAMEKVAQARNARAAQCGHCVHVRLICSMAGASMAGQRAKLPQQISHRTRRVTRHRSAKHPPWSIATLSRGAPSSPTVMFRTMVPMMTVLVRQLQATRELVAGRRGGSTRKCVQKRNAATPKLLATASGPCGSSGRLCNGKACVHRSPVTEAAVATTARAVTPTT